jgi:hypothetical protein
MAEWYGCARHYHRTKRPSPTQLAKKIIDIAASNVEEQRLGRSTPKGEKRIAPRARRKASTVIAKGERLR